MQDAQPRFDASISLRGERVHFQIEKKLIQFDADSIQVAGEFSAPRGVYDADYFFVFKVRGHDNLIEVPAYTEGVFEFLSDLKGLLPGMKNPRLQMSADFDSSVMFPGELEGRPVFHFRPEVKPWINLPMIRNLVWVETMVKELNPELETAGF